MSSFKYVETQCTDQAVFIAEKLRRIYGEKMVCAIEGKKLCN